MPPASTEVVQDSGVQSGSVKDRMNHLTSMVQELARLVASSVAPPSAQPPEVVPQGAPAASSSEALVPGESHGYKIPKLRLLSGVAARTDTGYPPGSPSSFSSSSSSSDDDDKPACRMCGSHKHHEKDCPQAYSQQEA